MKEMYTIHSPQLERDVEIQVILPNTYSRGNERYPVLYFYDGSRLCAEPEGTGASSVMGSLGYDIYQEAYARFLPAVILVGIAAPKDMWQRTAEYSPYTKQFDVPEGVNFEPHVHGKGQLLGDWVVTGLKPWIDSHYRTMPEAEYTGIGGMSTSGLNALYMLTAYPQVFHRGIAFAPAIHLWMDRLTETINAGDYSHIRFLYLDIGTEDCTRMVKKGDSYRDLLQVMELLKGRGLEEKNLRFFRIYQGKHDCSTWQLTFPDALRWAFQDMPLDEKAQ